MHYLARAGNLIEAALWFVVALTLTFLSARRGAKHRIFWFLAAAFAVFGVSDIIESRTGAWWKPWWLLAIKATCLACLLIDFRAWYRARH